MGTTFNSSYATNLSGMVFGRLTVVSYAGARAHAMWDCKCECGKIRRVRGSKLTCKKVIECVPCSKSRGNAAGSVTRSKPDDAVAMRRAIGHYQVNARKKRRAFGLSTEQARLLLLSHCHYCGIPPSTLVKGKGKKSGILVSGIDRVDSSLGYEVGNVVLCCSTCNFAKREMSKEEFLSWVERVHQHQRTSQ